MNGLNRVFVLDSSGNFGYVTNGARKDMLNASLI